MDIAALTLFATALFVAAASPGPGIAAILARVLGRGTSGALAFGVGLAIGDVVWLSLAIFGLAALAQGFHALFLVVKYAGAAYLLYLAYRLWTAPTAPVAVAAQTRAEHPARLFLGGLAVTLGNPKVMVFYLALLPTLFDLTAVTMLGYAELVAVTLAILAIVFSGYVALAARARALLTSERGRRVANRVSGATMGGAALAIAAR